MKKSLNTRPVAAATTQPRLFVYGRFSSARQDKGDSFARQMDYARRWAGEHGYVIDDSLTMFDHGLSAYKGEHVRKGALGAFLAAIRQKKLVCAGDVLLVESLDRLSRAEPINAQRQFSDIIDSGVAIVTADDGQVYSKEGLERDPSPLFVALAYMIRAHDESASKGRRVRDALRRQCQNWVTGEWRGRLNAGSDPAWVRYNPERRAFDLDPQQVESVRTMIDLYREGYGPSRAFAVMRERGIPIPAGTSDACRAHKIMENRSLLGEKIVTVEGDPRNHVETQTFVLHGYYPAVMTEAEFASLQFVRGQRGRRAGRGSVTGIMTGIGITFCAHCGFAMANQNSAPYVRKDTGTLRDGQRRILCSGWQKAANRCRVHGCSIIPIERALMKFCSDQMNLAALFADHDERSRKIADALALARQAVAGTEKQIRKFMMAAASDDSVTPEAMKAFTRELQERLGAEQRKVSDYEHELESLSRHARPAVADAWAELREGVEALDPDARMKARQLVMDTFRRIEISLADRERIGLCFVSKRDIVVVLWLDRKTGEYVQDPIFEPVLLENSNHAALAWVPAAMKDAA
ncbi:recombinase family protein [Paraburkholderia adhaesiva]|uniref:recombinase family protein n=1 Tax=Paraburkholderia adhaesiva TaxID=2883244 RepID=UPI001F3A8F96|nr:recombinase family protein [Paraburkholderia adhaesiva]